MIRKYYDIDLATSGSDTPKPEEMTFEKMIFNSFNVTFITPEELNTLCKAVELYTEAKVKAAYLQRDCTHEPLTDTGVGYYHCPACNEGWTYAEWQQLQTTTPNPLSVEERAREYADKMSFDSLDYEMVYDAYLAGAAS